MKCKNIIRKDKSNAGSEIGLLNLCFFNTENTVSAHYCFLVETDIGQEQGLSFWAWQGTGCCFVVSDQC